MIELIREKVNAPEGVASQAAPLPRHLGIRTSERVREFDEILPELAHAREQQWAAIRAWNTAMEPTPSDDGPEIEAVIEATNRVTSLQEELIERLAFATRPDGEDPGIGYRLSLALARRGVIP
jgi:hypothetical protein